MKLYVGETQLCSEVKEWSLKEYGYIYDITFSYDKKDDDGESIDEVINGPFIVHHVDEENCSVTFAHVNPDNENVPDGLAVTITKDILGKVSNVLICMNNTNIHLFPHIRTINPEILKMWEKCEKDKTDMYLKYHDPVSDKNILGHVGNMFTRTVIIDYPTNCGYNRTNIPKSEEHLDMDVDVIVW